MDGKVKTKKLNICYVPGVDNLTGLTSKRDPQGYIVDDNGNRLTRPILPIPGKHPNHDPNASFIPIPKFSNQVPIKSSNLDPDYLAQPSISNPTTVRPRAVYPGTAKPGLPLDGIKRKASPVLTINPKRINIRVNPVGSESVTLPLPPS